MNSTPIPLTTDGSGPAGAIPVSIYGASSNPSEIRSPDGMVYANAGDEGMFRTEVETVNGKGILRILDVGGVLSALLTDEDGNPLSSAWSPSGIVVNQDLDVRIPKPPETGTYVLQAVNGIPTWVTP